VPKRQLSRSGEPEGLKLVGFAVWERRSGNGRNVTFPARQYSVSGERRSFALLRPRVGAESYQSSGGPRDLWTDSRRYDRTGSVVVRGAASNAVLPRRSTRP